MKEEVAVMERLLRHELDVGAHAASALQTRTGRLSVRCNA